MENLPKWLFRIMIVIGAIAFFSTYAMRHDFSKGWAPSFNDDEYTPPGASAPAPAAVAPVTAPAAPAQEAVKPAAVAAAATPAPAPAARPFVPCQPIGRTAKGDLVYSMDCRTPPQ
jgi:hypothetical protein